MYERKPTTIVDWILAILFLLFLGSLAPSGDGPHEYGRYGAVGTPTDRAVS